MIEALDPGPHAVSCQFYRTRWGLPHKQNARESLLLYSTTTSSAQNLCCKAPPLALDLFNVDAGQVESPQAAPQG